MRIILNPEESVARSLRKGKKARGPEQADRVARTRSLRDDRSSLPPAGPVARERRQGERRSGKDRRKQQVPVILDTRSRHDRRAIGSDRRGQARPGKREPGARRPTRRIDLKA